MKGMILAAGFGTRMLPLTRRLPKALLPVGGRSLLEWNLRYLGGEGVTEVVVNAHHRAEEMRSAVEFLHAARAREAAVPGGADAGSSGAHRLAPLPVIRLLVEEEILGTGGGIAHAAPFLDTDPVVVMNVDLLIRQSLRTVVSAHIASGALATLICVRDPLHAQIRVDGDRITGILPAPRFGDPDLWGFTGVYLLARAAVERLADRAHAAGGRASFGVLPDFLAWMREGRLTACCSDDAGFIEAGTPEAYFEAARSRGGEGFRDVDARATLGAGARIEQSVILDGAVVDAGAVVRRAILGPGARASGTVERVVAADGDSRPLGVLEAEEELRLTEFLRRPRPEPAGNTRPDGGDSTRTPASSGRLVFRRLHGDGSTRRILRVIEGAESRILVHSPPPDARESAVYPHRPGPAAPSETASFVYVRGYLHSLGVRVPRIDAADEAARLVLLEDLGETHLYDLCRPRPADPDEARRERCRQWYPWALEIWRRMHSGVGAPFDPARTHNVDYDRAFILRFEAGYFLREMVRGYCGITDAPLLAAVERETEQAAEEALHGSPASFLHRDFQSRNLMVAGDELAVIDFQGARAGPPEYDLASLLLDPYVALPADLREELEEQALGTPAGILTPALARRRYRACAINRMMQALGAFAYLGGRRRNPGFLEHAPAAAARLREATEAEYPHLARLADRVAAVLAEKPGDNLAKPES